MMVNKSHLFKNYLQRSSGATFNSPFDLEGFSAKYVSYENKNFGN